MNARKCPVCEKELKGRPDKKFCDPSCKSAFHYNAMQEAGHSFYSRVDRQLKTNRRILKNYNNAGKSTLRAHVLISEGFNPRFFTHYWKNNQGDLYLFVYDYGYLSRMENGNKKYILITWQPYMENFK